jgi:hypothetical protein
MRTGVPRAVPGTALAAVLATWLLGGCAAPVADPAHPVAAVGWVETRLYFGLGPAGRSGQDGGAAGSKGVSQAAWLSFLDREVTPRFPDGLSVIDVYGQWQGPDETAPERLRSKMLVIDHPDDSADETKLAAIRSAWRRMTGDRSVLSVTQTARVSF